jgi:hypothetical protein
MFDRDIFKALIDGISGTREVEIGYDGCFEQLAASWRFQVFSLLPAPVSAWTGIESGRGA